MDDRNYQKAQRRVRRKKGFYYHFSFYVAVGVFLAFINFFVDPNFIWFPIPIAAWGLVVFLHYLIAVGVPFLNLDKNWEKRQIEKEMRKMNRSSPGSLPAPDIAEEELELKEFKQLRQEWDEQEFV